MIPYAGKFGPAAILLFWIVLCMGALIGAAVGYQAEAGEYATMEYDTASGELTIANVTTDVWAEEEAAVNESENGLLPPEAVDMDGGPLDAASSEDGDDDADAEFGIEGESDLTAPAAVTTASEIVTQGLVGQALSVAAMSGDIAASVVFEIRGSVPWPVIGWSIVVAMYAPPVGAVYLLTRRLRS